MMVPFWNVLLSGQLKVPSQQQSQMRHSHVMASLCTQALVTGARVFLMAEAYRLVVDQPFYRPRGMSGVRAYPVAVAANPVECRQFALCMSDGGVLVVEPVDSDGEWRPGSPPGSGAVSRQSYRMVYDVTRNSCSTYLVQIVVRSGRCCCLAISNFLQSYRGHPQGL